MSLRRKKTFKESASDFAESILPALESAVDTAMDTAKELATDAKDKAAPVIADAREKAAPIIADSKAYATEKAAEAKVIAAEKTAEAKVAAAEKAAEAKVAAAEGRKVATEKARRGRRRTAVKVAAFKAAEPGNRVSAVAGAEPKKGGKLKKLFIVGALAGLGALVFKRLKGGSDDSWQSSYTPAPAPTARPSAAPVNAADNEASPAPGSTGPTADDLAGEHDDLGAASPDEALADAAEHPHRDTTPDDPLEVVELDADKKA
jgi:hypothetical protein